MYEEPFKSMHDFIGHMNDVYEDQNYHTMPYLICFIMLTIINVHHCFKFKWCLCDVDAENFGT